jgi:hypothetical protein
MKVYAERVKNIDLQTRRRRYPTNKEVDSDSVSRNVKSNVKSN